MDKGEQLYLAAQPTWLWLNYIGLAGFAALVLRVLSVSGGNTRSRARRRAGSDATSRQAPQPFLFF
jgi:hypothetical protein